MTCKQTTGSATAAQVNKLSINERYGKWAQVEQQHQAQSREAPPREAPPPQPQLNVSAAPSRRKLTVLEVYGKLPPMERNQPTRWHGNWFCYVTGAKEEASQLGPFTRWLGAFKHIHLGTGEVLESNTCILPGIASDRIAAAFAGGANIGGEAQNVMLAFQLGTDFDMNKAGYKFTIRTIAAPSHTSPLDRFMEECYRQPLLEDQRGEDAGAEAAG